MRNMHAHSSSVRFPVEITAYDIDLNSKKHGKIKATNEWMNEWIKERLNKWTNGNY